MKKYLIYLSIMLISAFAFSVQVGIGEEIVWHGWGGFGKTIYVGWWAFEETAWLGS